MLPAAAAATQTVLQDSRKVAALAGFLPGHPVLSLAKNLDVRAGVQVGMRKPFGLNQLVSDCCPFSGIGSTDCHPVRLK